MSVLDDAIDILKRVGSGAKDALSEGREDHREALKRGYAAEQKQGEGTMADQLFGSNPSITRTRDLLNLSAPAHRQARKDMGLGLSDDMAKRTGQMIGTAASDLVQDRGRSIWWLINAPQALANVALDGALKTVSPNLYDSDLVRLDRDTGLVTKDLTGSPITDPRVAEMSGIAYNAGTKAQPNILPKKGYSRSASGYQQRRYAPGLIDLLQIPTGLAVNSGIGLMNPFGGQEGYKAVFESDEDPSKTSNVLAEVAAKYVLGRTGNLLPWDEFKKVRPDVSKDEYMRYKAFKFDNDGDGDVSDGTLSIPTGVLKYNNDGIHGAEVQFLGRSLPVATAILPTVAAIGGTAYGARGGIKRGLGYGSLATGLGMLGGNIIEGERRRRNAEENQLDTIN